MSDAGRNDHEPWSEPLRLELVAGERALGHLGEFESAIDELSQSFEAPAEAESEAAGADPGSALERTRASLDRIHRAIRALLAEPVRANDLLAELARQMSDEEAQWRSLFEQMRDRPKEFDTAKAMLLDKYRAFLISQLAVLEAAVRDSHTRAEPPSGRSLEEDTWIGAAHEVRLSKSASFMVDPTDVMRLPRGKRVRIALGDAQALRFWMSRRRFVVNFEAEPYLLDDEGYTMPFQEGSNLIGRATYNDVIIRPNYVDVSRRHAIVDFEEGRPVAFTDVSSGGTYLPRDAVVREEEEGK